MGAAAAPGPSERAATPGEKSPPAAMAGVAGALNVLPDAELLAVDAAHCSACPKKYRNDMSSECEYQKQVTPLGSILSRDRCPRELTFLGTRQPPVSFCHSVCS